MNKAQQANRSVHMLNEGLSADVKKASDAMGSLTDSNDHTGALLVLAKLLGDKLSVKKLTDIDDAVNKAGATSDALYKQREEIRKVLMARSEKQLSPEDHKALYNSL